MIIVQRHKGDTLLILNVISCIIFVEAMMVMNSLEKSNHNKLQWHANIETQNLFQQNVHEINIHVKLVG